MITATVTAAALTAVSDITLTEGMVGQECSFTFSTEWDGLAREVVFEGAEAKSVVLLNSDTVVIPPEVFANAAGYNLRISAIGRAEDGSVVIPTVWGKVTKIQASAMSSEYSESSWEPTPNQVAQITTAAANAEALTRAAKRSADEAAASASTAASDAAAAAATAVTQVLGTKQDRLTAEGRVTIGVDNSIDLSSGTQDWIRSTGQSVSQLVSAVQFINRESLPGKQDKLTAGNAITISGDTIGVTSGVFGSAADVQDAYNRAVYASNVGVTQAARVTTLIDNKEDKLVAGSGITLVTTQTGTSTEGVPIKRTTISATGGGSYDDTELRGRITTIEGKESGWDGKQDVITDLDTIRSGAAAGAAAVQPELSVSAAELDFDTADTIRGYVKTEAGVNSYNRSSTNAHQIVRYPVEGLDYISFSGELPTANTPRCAFSASDNLTDAEANLTELIKANEAQSCLRVPEGARIFIASFSRNSLGYNPQSELVNPRTVHVYKNAAITDLGAELNRVIADKLGVLETRTAELLTLVGVSE